MGSFGQKLGTNVPSGFFEQKDISVLPVQEKYFMGRLFSRKT
jgi:hypothetical protein